MSKSASKLLAGCVLVGLAALFDYGVHTDDHPDFCEFPSSELVEG